MSELRYETYTSKLDMRPRLSARLVLWIRLRFHPTRRRLQAPVALWGGRKGQLQFGSREDRHREGMRYRIRLHYIDIEREMIFGKGNAVGKSCLKGLIQ